GAKAGVMFRDSAAANAPEASVVLTPSGGVQFLWRTYAGAATSYTAVTGVAAPQWLRLTRVGTSLSAFYSTDGVNFTPVGSTQQVALSNTALGGLAVSAHSASATATATFDSVPLDPAPPPAPLEGDWSS